MGHTPEMKPLVPITLAVVVIVDLVMFFTRLGPHRKTVFACTVAGLFAGGWAIAEILRHMNHWRKHRNANETMFMEQRFPFCHVTRLSNGQWFLTEKATGRKFDPPGLRTHRPTSQIDRSAT
ncbi:hypothetical protein [Burkholderia ubonensis]|nr:hypothetical protein [Burkholderia ubonensis]